MPAGRKAEPGISYYPCLTNHTEHEKLRSLFDEFDSHGYWIYKCLLDRIYSKKGYYMEFTNRALMEQFAKDVCKKQVTLVDEVVSGCLSRLLFDKRVAEMFGVLTSDRIQENYLFATRDRRKKGTIITFSSDYLLIDLSEEQQIVILPQKNEILTGRLNSSREQLNVPPKNTSPPVSGEVNSSREELIVPVNNELFPPKEEKRRNQIKVEEKKKQKNSSHHQFFELILKDHDFTGPVMEQFGVNEKKFAGALADFFRFKKMLHEDNWTGLRDCQVNFLNWLPSALTHSNGNGKGPVIGQPVYNPPKPNPEPVTNGLSDAELAEKNKLARAAIMRDIEADVVLYSENENCILKIPTLKYDVLAEEKLIDPTTCELPNYRNFARGKRYEELKSSYDKAARVKQRHYDEGRTPIDDQPLLKSYAKEFAYRDYLKKRVDENVLRN